MTALTQLRRAWGCRVARLRIDSGGVGGSHVGACLACQAEVSRRRSLHRELAALRTTSVDAPPEILDEVLAAIDGPGRVEGSSRRWGIAGVSSLVAAALTGLAVTIVRRRARPA